MKGPKTFLLVSVVVAVLILGVAYAAIQDITLTVEGSAEAAPSDANFNVEFTKASYDGVGTGRADIEEDTLKASMSVTDLVKVNDTFTATFEITNKSTDLEAVLNSVLTTNSNPEYFEVTQALENDELAANGGKTNLVVNVKLIKLPITANVSTNINVTVTASPENPAPQV